MSASNSAGSSGYSNTACATIAQAPTVPATPTGLTATAQTAAVSLAWMDNATNETAYAVDRALGTSGSFTRLGSLAANSVKYTDSAVTAGQQDLLPRLGLQQRRLLGLLGDGVRHRPAAARVGAGDAERADRDGPVERGGADLDGQREQRDRLRGGPGARHQRHLLMPGQPRRQRRELHGRSRDGRPAGTCYRVSASNSAGTSAYSSVACATVPSSGTAVAVDFDNPAPSGSSGSWMTTFGGINWGSSQWKWWGAESGMDATNHVDFGASGVTSRQFTFSPGPKTLTTVTFVSYKSGMVTVSDNNGQKTAVSLVPGQAVVATLGWTKASTTIKVSSSVGWDMAITALSYK